MQQKQLETQKEIIDELEEHVSDLEKELKDSKDEHQKALLALRQNLLENAATKEELAIHEEALKKLGNLCIKLEEKNENRG